MQQMSIDTHFLQPIHNTGYPESISTGSLTEIIVDESSSLQAFHLINILMHCKIEDRWLMWLSPTKGINKSWLHNLGLSSAPVVYIETDLNNQIQLSKKILAAQTSHLILEWIGELDAQTQAELSKLARLTGTEIMLVRKR